MKFVRTHWSLVNNSVCFALCALFLALSHSAGAQQPKRVPKIGYLSGTGSEVPNAVAFRQGLRDLGYIEGKSILVEYRSVEGKLDRASGLVAELVRLKVDLVVVTFLVGIRAAKDATKTTPIVIVSYADPVETGIIDSLARPGGNITGLAALSRDLSRKRLELLREVVPRMSRVGVLWDADAPGPAISFKEYEVAARALKIQLHSLEVRGPEPNLDGVFQTVIKERVGTLITVRNPLLGRYRNPIVELATKNRLPLMCEGSEYVEAGCLMSYSAIEADLYRRAATYVDKILKGSKPADLPVEQPTKFELLINLKTAKQISLAIPPNVLARADRVIK